MELITVLGGVQAAASKISTEPFEDTILPKGDRVSDTVLPWPKGLEDSWEMAGFWTFWGESKG